jgi:ribosomal protein S18 acetylase RimI-like enzyme
MLLDFELQIEKLESSHLRDEFNCGDPGLNDFIRQYAGQNAKKRFSTTYVAVKKDTIHVLAYYSISVGSIVCEALPDQERRGLPSYPVPVAKLSRLAVDQSVQHRGLGRILLIDALEKILSIADEIEVFAVEVDALNEAAKRFYQRFGFQTLKDDALHLYLPMKTVAVLFH